MYPTVKISNPGESLTITTGDATLCPESEIVIENFCFKIRIRTANFSVAVRIFDHYATVIFKNTINNDHCFKRVTLIAVFYLF